MGSGARAFLDGSDVSRAKGPLDDSTMRRAGDGDVAAITRIERGSFPDPWSEHDFRSVLGFAQGIFLVSVKQATGAISGYAIAIRVVDEAEILNLAVDGEARAVGLGGWLLDAVLGEAEGMGVVTTFLEVRESNVAARKLYASRGFAEISRRRKYYRNPSEDALVLRRAVQR